MKFLPFISTSNPINPPVYNAIQNSVEVLKRNNIPGLESIKLINTKQQPPNLKKLLTKAEFCNEEVRKFIDGIASTKIPIAKTQSLYFFWLTTFFRCSQLLLCENPLA